MRRRMVTQTLIENFRQVIIKLAIARSALSELESFGHLYDNAAALVKPTLVALEIRVEKLEKERDAMVF